MNARGFGRAHLDPRAQHAGEIAYRECWFVGIAQAIREGQPVRIFEAVGEHACAQELLGLGRVPRDKQVERLVNAPVHV